MFLAIKGVQQVSEANNCGATFSDLSRMRYSAMLSYRWQRQLVYTSSRLSSMYVACLGPWMGGDCHTQLAGPVAHGDVVHPIYAPHTIVYQRSGRLCREYIFAHPIHCD